VLFLALETVSFSIGKTEFRLRGRTRVLSSVRNVLDTVLIFRHPVFELQADLQSMLSILTTEERSRGTILAATRLIPKLFCRRFMP